MATQQGPTPDDTGLEQLQIHRGAQVEATDGVVGTVEQIVMDRNTGELRAFVIRSADGHSEFELPATYMQRSTGEHVYLDLSKEQIANNPGLARPYDPNQYMPVYEGQMEPTPAATEIAHETGRPIVTDVETNSAQVVAPVTSEELPRNETPLTATQAVLSPNQAQPVGPQDTGGAPTHRAAPGSAAAVPNAASPIGAAGGPGNQPTPSQQDMRAPDCAAAREGVPEPEPSRRPGVSGGLEGGLPSTSGMGPKSTVPPSPAPPMDTAGTERDAATFNAPEQHAVPNDEEARTTTPGMYADFTAAPEVVAPFEALTEQGMTPQPGVTNAPVNPTREDTAGGVLQTPITDTPLTPANAGQLTVPEQQALDESHQLFRYDEIYPQEPPRTSGESGANPAVPSSSLLGDTGPLLGKVQPTRPTPDVPLTSGYLTPTPPPTLSATPSRQAGGMSLASGAVALAAAGLAIGAGAGAGIAIALLRRRAQPSIAQSAASTASNVADTVSSAVGGAAGAAQDALKRLVERAQPAGADLSSTVQDVASQAAESVKSAGKSATQTVSEAGATAGASLAAVNWRPRVFRWGLLLGALGGVLFAPRPGRVLRDQLAHQLNRLLSRAA